MRIAVIGAGGGSRAVCYALAQDGVRVAPFSHFDPAPFVDPSPAGVEKAFAVTVSDLMTKDSSLIYILGLTASQYELTKFGREAISNPEAGLKIGRAHV